MVKEGSTILTGVIIKILPCTTFEVQLDNSTHVLICKAKGSIQQRRIRLLRGDLVSVEFNPNYDKKKGFILHRLKRK